MFNLINLKKNHLNILLQFIETCKIYILLKSAKNMSINTVIPIRNELRIFVSFVYKCKVFYQNREFLCFGAI